MSIALPHTHTLHGSPNSSSTSTQSARKQFTSARARIRQIWSAYFPLDGAFFAPNVMPPFTMGKQSTKVRRTLFTMPPVALQLLHLSHRHCHCCNRICHSCSDALAYHCHSPALFLALLSPCSSSIDAGGRRCHSFAHPRHRCTNRAKLGGEKVSLGGGGVD